MSKEVVEVFENLSDKDRVKLINYLLHSMYQPVFIPTETECTVVTGIMDNGKNFYIQDNDFKGDCDED